MKRVAIRVERVTMPSSKVPTIFVYGNARDGKNPRLFLDVRNLMSTAEEESAEKESGGPAAARAKPVGAEKKVRSTPKPKRAGKEGGGKAKPKARSAGKGGGKAKARPKTQGEPGSGIKEDRKRGRGNAKGAVKKGDNKKTRRG